MQCFRSYFYDIFDIFIQRQTLLPRGQQPNQLREKIQQVNKLVAEKYSATGTNKIQTVQIDKGWLEQRRHFLSHGIFHRNYNFVWVLFFFFVHMISGLVQADGTISHHDMFDYLNLTNAGYKKVFEPIYDLLSQILNENEPEKDLTPSE